MNRNHNKMNIGIVSQYPPPHSTHSRQSGIASYTKNLTTAMRNQGYNVKVFCNKLDGISQSYNEDGVEVSRCWEMGVRSILQIARALWRARKELDVIHIQYTFALYGGAGSAAVFPLLLLLLKLSRIPVVVTMHEVVPLSAVNNNFWDETGIKKNRTILKAGMHRLVQMVNFLSSRVIVHEPIFKDVMETEYGCSPGKISVIPHGVEKYDGLTGNFLARKLLDIKQKRVLLFFGYLAKYKGLERLIDAFAKLSDDYILIIAGGEHPRLKGDPDYESYLTLLRKRASHSKGEVRFTGFVDETKIPIYFSAADVLLLPYTKLTSASGPLALCVSNKKPFLAAQSLAGVIGEPDILFTNTATGLRNKIEQFFANGVIRRKSLAYVETLLQSRSWSIIADVTTRLYAQMLSERTVTDPVALPEIPVFENSNSTLEAGKELDALARRPMLPL